MDDTRFEYPDKPIDRGKILWEEDLEKIKENWGRYKDLDGDWIPYRTVPGNKHPNAAYFTRGTGHDEYANYSEDPEVWEAGLKRISDKVLSSRDALPAPVIETMEGAKFGIILWARPNRPWTKRAPSWRRKACHPTACGSGHCRWRLR